MDWARIERAAARRAESSLLYSEIKQTSFQANPSLNESFNDDSRHHQNLNSSMNSDIPEQEVSHQYIDSITREIASLRSNVKSTVSKSSSFERQLAGYADVVESVRMTAADVTDKYETVDEAVRSLRSNVGELTHSHAEFTGRLRKVETKLSEIDRSTVKQSTEYASKDSFTKLLGTTIDQLSSIASISENASRQSSRSISHYESLISAIMDLKGADRSSSAFRGEMLSLFSGDLSKDQVTRLLIESLRAAIDNGVEEHVVAATNKLNNSMSSAITNVYAKNEQNSMDVAKQFQALAAEHMSVLQELRASEEERTATANNERLHWEARMSQLQEEMSQLIEARNQLASDNMVFREALTVQRGALDLVLGNQKQETDNAAVIAEMTEQQAIYKSQFEESRVQMQQMHDDALARRKEVEELKEQLSITALALDEIKAQIGNGSGQAASALRAADEKGVLCDTVEKVRKLEEKVYEMQGDHDTHKAVVKSQMDGQAESLADVRNDVNDVCDSVTELSGDVAALLANAKETAEARETMKNQQAAQASAIGAGTQALAEVNKLAPQVVEAVLATTDMQKRVDELTAELSRTKQQHDTTLRQVVEDNRVEIMQEQSKALVHEARRTQERIANALTESESRIIAEMEITAQVSKDTLSSILATQGAHSAKLSAVELSSKTALDEAVGALSAEIQAMQNRAKADKSGEHVAILSNLVHEVEDLKSQVNKLHEKTEQQKVFIKGSLDNNMEQCREEIARANAETENVFEKLRQVESELAQRMTSTWNIVREETSALSTKIESLETDTRSKIRSAGVEANSFRLNQAETLDACMATLVQKQNEVSSLVAANAARFEAQTVEMAQRAATEQCRSLSADLAGVIDKYRIMDASVRDAEAKMQSAIESLTGVAQQQFDLTRIQEKQQFDTNQLEEQLRAVQSQLKAREEALRKISGDVSTLQSLQRGLQSTCDELKYDALQVSSKVDVLEQQTLRLELQRPSTAVPSSSMHSYQSAKSNTSQRRLGGRDEREDGGSEEEEQEEQEQWDVYKGGAGSPSKAGNHTPSSKQSQVQVENAISALRVRTDGQLNALAEQVSRIQTQSATNEEIAKRDAAQHAADANDRLRELEREIAAINAANADNTRRVKEIEGMVSSQKELQNGLHDIQTWVSDHSEVKRRLASLEQSKSEVTTAAIAACVQAMSSSTNTSAVNSPVKSSSSRRFMFDDDDIDGDDGGSDGEDKREEERKNTAKVLKLKIKQHVATQINEATLKYDKQHQDMMEMVSVLNSQLTQQDEVLKAQLQKVSQSEVRLGRLETKMGNLQLEIDAVQQELQVVSDSLIASGQFPHLSDETAAVVKETIGGAPKATLSDIYTAGSSSSEHHFAKESSMTPGKRFPSPRNSNSFYETEHPRLVSNTADDDDDDDSINGKSNSKRAISARTGESSSQKQLQQQQQQQQLFDVHSVSPADAAAAADDATKRYNSGELSLISSAASTTSAVVDKAMQPFVSSPLFKDKIAAEETRSSTQPAAESSPLLRQQQKAVHELLTQQQQQQGLASVSDVNKLTSESAAILQSFQSSDHEDQVGGNQDKHEDSEEDRKENSECKSPAFDTKNNTATAISAATVAAGADEEVSFDDSSSSSNSSNSHRNSFTESEAGPDLDNLAAHAEDLDADEDRADEDDAKYAAAEEVGVITVSGRQHGHGTTNTSRGLDANEDTVRVMKSAKDNSFDDKDGASSEDGCDSGADDDDTVPITSKTNSVDDNDNDDGNNADTFQEKGSNLESDRPSALSQRSNSTPTRNEPEGEPVISSSSSSSCTGVKPSSLVTQFDQDDSFDQDEEDEKEKKNDQASHESSPQHQQAREKAGSTTKTAPKHVVASSSYEADGDGDEEGDDTHDRPRTDKKDENDRNEEGEDNDDDDYEEELMSPSDEMERQLALQARHRIKSAAAAASSSAKPGTNNSNSTSEAYRTISNIQQPVLSTFTDDSSRNDDEIDNDDDAASTQSAGEGPETIDDSSSFASSSAHSSPSKPLSATAPTFVPGVALTPPNASSSSSSSKLAPAQTTATEIVNRPPPAGPVLSGSLLQRSRALPSVSSSTSTSSTTTVPPVPPKYIEGDQQDSSCSPTTVSPPTASTSSAVTAGPKTREISAATISASMYVPSYASSLPNSSATKSTPGSPAAPSSVAKTNNNSILSKGPAVQATASSAPVLTALNSTQCIFCLKRVHQKEFAAHKSTCDLRTEPCSAGCGMRIRPAKLVQHLEVCPRRKNSTGTSNKPVGTAVPSTSSRPNPAEATGLSTDPASTPPVSALSIAAKDKEIHSPAAADDDDDDNNVVRVTATTTTTTTTTSDKTNAEHDVVVAAESHNGSDSFDESFDESDDESRHNRKPTAVSLGLSINSSVTSPSSLVSSSTARLELGQRSPSFTATRAAEIRTRLSPRSQSGASSSASSPRIITTGATATSGKTAEGFVGTNRSSDNQRGDVSAPNDDDVQSFEDAFSDNDSEEHYRV